MKELNKLILFVTIPLWIIPAALYLLFVALSEAYDEIFDNK